MSVAQRELPTEANIINLGLPLFAEAVREQGATVTHVDWGVPSGSEPDVVAALTRSYGVRSVAFDVANAEVIARLDKASPMLTAVAPAGDVIPRLGDRMLLHAGPPIEYGAVCDPLRRSMRAAVIAEGWATGIDSAESLLASGKVALGAANDHDTVVPMATALGPTTPVWVADNREAGTRGFSPVNQGPGEVPWFGRETPAAVDRLIFLRDIAQPRLSKILEGLAESKGPLDIMSMAAQGVQMGDDVHMRTQATTNLLVREMLPFIAALGDDAGSLEFADYLSKNHLFYLTIAMAAAKSLTLSAQQVPGSTVVTSMARNGTTFGVKIGASRVWHITDAPPVADALYYAGFTDRDAALDIGDSAVLELVGLGGAAAAGSPAVAAFLGGSMADAARATEEMTRVCLADSTRFKIPVQGFRGTPLAVDVRKVVETGIRPKVTTGILHHSSGGGQIGAGVATAPIEGFRAGLFALDDDGAGM
jgi:hypothetical protein